MKITITDEEIRVEGYHRDLIPGAIGLDCREAAIEACAWAVKRLGEEMEKSMSFYRTSEPVDNIVMGGDE